MTAARAAHESTSLNLRMEALLRPDSALPGRMYSCRIGVAPFVPQLLRGEAGIGAGNSVATTLGTQGAVFGQQVVVSTGSVHIGDLHNAAPLAPHAIQLSQSLIVSSGILFIIEKRATPVISFRRLADPQ